MHHPVRHGARKALACALFTGAALSTAFAADTTAAPAPAADAPQQAQQAPAPNPAAEKALGQRFQSILSALEGKAALPDAKNFTEEFNRQVTKEQMTSVLQQVHDSVGSCRIAGQMRSPVPVATAYLLQCDKAFVPMEISVEEKAPYRIHSLLIQPGFWKK